MIILFIDLTPRVFRCEKCPKSYSQAAGLSRHLKIHLGLDKTLCSSCNQYVSKDHLARHLKLHEDPTYKARTSRNENNEIYLTI